MKNEGIPPEPYGSPEPPESLLDALLYAVSHDLRSPLLTVSLSSELIEESLRDAVGTRGQSVGVALEALRHGSQDLERMLRSINALSRARRRPLESSTVPLGTLLGGHVVISEADGLQQLAVRVDPVPVRELIEEIAGADLAKIELDMEPDHVRLRIMSGTRLPEIEGSPVMALARSLQQHAGSIVERLAVAQLLLARQGAALEIDGGRARARLPLARSRR